MERKAAPCHLQGWVGSEEEIRRGKGSTSLAPPLLGADFWVIITPVFALFKSHPTLFTEMLPHGIM